jgi:SAM-dependent methyltransferase
MDSDSRLPSRLAILVLFGLTIFVSAFLLFQVQPMVSKAILPWFGGGPAVWTAAMLFFQCVLFGGYLYAHAVGSIGSPKREAIVHLALLALAAVVARGVVPDASLRPDGDLAPVAQIVWILAVSVGLPYFCLASTGPLLQHWFARGGVGGSVYRLYALSNVGSLLALLSFPYVFEPWFDLPTLGWGWTLGFWLFALTCAAIAVIQARVAAMPATSRPDPAGAAAPAVSAAPIRWRDRAGWVMLPALASLLFIATTDHASHDIAPEPRLWILTLSLYLLSFIVSFDHPRWYRAGWVAGAALLAVLFISGRHAIPELFGGYWGYGLSELRWLHGVMLFLVCLVCHGELYRRRPADTSKLTAYYLWMSLGGACGGLFVALVATHVFNDFYEWSIGLAAAAALCVLVVRRELPARVRTVLRPALTGGVVLVCAGLAFWWDNPLRGRQSHLAGAEETTLDQARNFYGVVAVRERRFPADPERDHRVFYSGQITHGIQYLSPKLANIPLSYYGTQSGVGETLNYLKARRSEMDVALVGLGVGTLALYARPADRYDLFEINPEVERVARQWFTNLPQSGADGLRVIVGDARLKFEQLPADRRYDVIVLDAFSGGSVPVHLLTREAFKVYAAHLKPDGFLVVHITNAYLNLYPVVMRQAEALEMRVRSRFQEKDPQRFIRENHYMILTRDEAYLRSHPAMDPPLRDAQGRVTGLRKLDIPGVGLWTDHFSSITPLEWRD